MCHTEQHDQDQQRWLRPIRPYTDSQITQQERYQRSTQHTLLSFINIYTLLFVKISHAISVTVTVLVHEHDVCLKITDRILFVIIEVDLCPILHCIVS